MYISDRWIRGVSRCLEVLNRDLQCLATAAAEALHLYRSEVFDISAVHDKNIEPFSIDSTTGCKTKQLSVLELQDVVHVHVLYYL